jgi:uroporphyrinogen-III synthase
VSPLPLAGRRILVTRAAHQAGKLSHALRVLGAEPVEVPVLEIRPPASYAPLDRALSQLGSYNWLVLTSANSVRALNERAAAIGACLATPSSLKVAAIGEATAAAARDAGFPVTVVPESYVAESLVEEILSGRHNVPGHDLSHADSRDESGHDFSHADSRHESGHDFSRADSGHKDASALAPAETIAGQRILLARAAIARDIIPDALRAAGAHVDVVDAYQNILPESAPVLLRQALTSKIDAATFTSSSSVTHLAAAATKAGIAFPLPGIPAVSIGPITSHTLRELGWPPAAEANQHDIPGLVAAVVSILDR